MDGVARVFARSGYVAYTFNRIGYGGSDGYRAQRYRSHETMGGCNTQDYETAGRLVADQIRPVVAELAKAPFVDPGRYVNRRCAPVTGGDTLNKAELAAHVTAHADLPKATADRAVSAVFAAIGDALAKDEAVTIAGFGTFSIRSRAARQGRNPQTGERIAIAASRTPAFKAGKTLRDTVNRRG